MPSGHAANWFAGSMIAFVYYPRSAWIMLPMALLVSLISESRLEQCRREIARRCCTERAK
jgi:membrane-associated phospholipid phosphatase